MKSYLVLLRDIFLLLKPGKHASCHAGSTFVIINIERVKGEGVL